jgi:hypothetical protein
MIKTGRNCRILAFTLLLTVTASVEAQQVPITGQMLAPTSPAPVAPVGNTTGTVAGSVAVDSVPAAVATQPTPSGAIPTTEVGDVTHQLLSLQVAGTQAGRLLPIPGQEASASYNRYLKSFEHPIPEFYETTVSKGQNSGSSGAGTQ